MDVDIATLKKQIMDSLDDMGISFESIILFGSRARGDYNEDSDYDILIVTEETFPFKKKMQISKEIRTRLAKLRISSDIIIKSINEFEYFRNKIGNVVREAIREGVTL